MTWVDGRDKCPPLGPWFGGWTFDVRRLWEGYPTSFWRLPAVMAWADSAGSFVAALGPSEAEASRSAQLATEGSLEAALPRRLIGDAAPDDDRIEKKQVDETRGQQKYERLVADALRFIEVGGATKIVPARRARRVSVRSWTVAEAADALFAGAPSTRVHAWRAADGSVFAGASPELLAAYDGRRFSTEALAGTATPDGEDALLEDPKEAAEHQCVVDFLVGVIARSGGRLTSPTKRSVRRLPGMTHLWTPLTVDVDGVEHAWSLAAALHPTPAVAGLPVDSAREFLAQHEDFSRGWYAGVLAESDGMRFSAHVALRCARVWERTVEAYAGAGVVRGSRPRSEWLETERKMGAVYGALQCQ